MDWTLDFHGSEVQWAKVADQQLRLRFSAALVRPGSGTAQLDEAYVKGVELLFSRANWTGELALCVGALSGSTLAVNGALLRRIALVFKATGGVRAEFAFSSGATLAVSAESVQCTAPPDPRFVASYAC